MQGNESLSTTFREELKKETRRLPHLRGEEKALESLAGSVHRRDDAGRQAAVDSMVNHHFREIKQWIMNRQPMFG